MPVVRDGSTEAALIEEFVYLLFMTGQRKSQVKFLSKESTELTVAET